MDSSIILILVFLIFGSLVFLFFYVAIKALFDADNTLVKEGKKDEEVLKEGAKIKNKKTSKIALFLTNVIGGAILIGCAALVILKNVSNPLAVFSAIPVAITSGSMEKADDSNTYLEANKLTNQFAAGSIIILHKLPAKDELKQFDVVAYRNKEGTTVVHRIIEFGYYDNDNFTITDNIKIATEFVFRGDNNTGNDTNYVAYDDMIGIYKGETVPLLGYVVDFAQSFFGLIAFAAVFGMLEAYEIFNKKSRKVLLDRYEIICGDYEVRYVKKGVNNNNNNANYYNNYYNNGYSNNAANNYNNNYNENNDYNNNDVNEDEDVGVRAIGYNQEDEEYSNEDNYGNDDEINE